VTLTDLGTHLKIQGHYKEGLSKYHEALTYDPKYAPAYYNIGVVYSELQQYQEALFNYNKAIELNPYYSEAYCNIGVIYKNMDRLEEAISYYEKAVSINPNFDIAKHNLAIAYTDLGTKVKNEGRLNVTISFVSSPRHSILPSLTHTHTLVTDFFSLVLFRRVLNFTNVHCISIRSMPMRIIISVLLMVKKVTLRKRRSSTNLPFTSILCVRWHTTTSE
jgi:tetratricopeptide (TPR) repeat protein